MASYESDSFNLSEMLIIPFILLLKIYRLVFFEIESGTKTGYEGSHIDLSLDTSQIWDKLSQIGVFVAFNFN
jgi:hypothetical protein